MAPFSVIVFGVVVLTIAVSGAKQLRLRLKTVSVDGALQNNKKNNRNNASSPKTATAATLRRQIELQAYESCYSSDHKTVNIDNKAVVFDDSDNL